VNLGFYTQGELHFWLRDVASDPPTIVASDGKSLKEELMSETETEINAAVPRTRIWTESNGQRQIKATFLRLVDGQVHFRREDGREVEVPLSSLSITDQQVVRQLARQQQSYVP
jgi:hypothetical protein